MSIPIAITSQPILRSRLDLLRSVASANTINRTSQIILELLDEIERVHALNATLLKRLEEAKVKSAPSPGKEVPAKGSRVSKGDVAREKAGRSR